MRDRETIDSELRLIALRRRSILEQGGQPSSLQVDELLDERLGHRAEASAAEAVEASEIDVVAAGSQRHKTNHIARRKGFLRRFGLLAVLPLSLLAVVTFVVIMFAAHEPDAAQPAAAPPPSDGRPNPAPPPQAHTPPIDIVDRAFIDALQQSGVPVPSHEYVTTHGHAVCDFLARQPNFAEGVQFVQRSSIWDANQSANFTAGAVVSYCPQYQPSSADEMQPGFQSALSGLQAIQRDLQSIQGGLQGIGDDLQGISGHQ